MAHRPAFPPRLDEDLRPGNLFEGEPPLPVFLLHSPDLPKGVSRKQAIDVVLRTPWAQKLAKGLAEAGGLKPSDASYQGFVDTFALKVATSLVAKL
ncbi:MAG: hypothetical protein Q8O76_04735 [Chloroflexota bacterium]|nr:hypothetical protein [Chloroflexota bacterium]